jgi:hypothetical protein
MFALSVQRQYTEDNLPDCSHRKKCTDIKRYFNEYYSIYNNKSVDDPDRKDYDEPRLCRRCGYWFECLNEVELNSKNYDCSNAFGDRKHHEHKKGCDRDNRHQNNTGNSDGPHKRDLLKRQNYPANYDWATLGGVTSVKNQGSCGSCWSFSSTGALEGAYFAKYKKLVSFSEQQLVSCADSTYGNHGCNGGWPSNAFRYWQLVTKGDNTEENYPYVCSQTGSGTAPSCNTALAKAVVSGTAVTGYYDSSQDRNCPDHINNAAAFDAALKAAVYRSPVSVAVCAGVPGFGQYKKGTIYGQSGVAPCQTPDHAVLVTGWGPGYWIVKNTWGTSWGNNGYINIAQGKGLIADFMYLTL